jgi:hypothetical protein
MAMTAVLGSSARLAYVVTELKGTVKRPVHFWTKDGGLQMRMEDQPGGFLVFCPRGHVVRLRDQKELEWYGVHRAAPVVNLQGLHSPNSPAGKLLAAQNDEERRAAFLDLKKAVIALATAKTGQVLTPEQVVSIEDEDVEN